MYEALRDEDKKILQSEPIVMGNEGWVISPSLISDCALRLDISNYLSNRSESESEDQKVIDFENRHSKEIVNVLRNIWNAPHFSVDGNRSEKYLLLLGKGLKEEDIIPFIKELLEMEGIQNSDDNQLDYILFTKPIPSLRPLLHQFLQDAENKKDLPQQARLIILLEQEKHEPDLLLKLDKISSNNSLSLDAHKALSEIIAKIKAGKKLSYNEVDDFNMAVL